MALAKISSKGQIIIPAKVRENHGLKGGSSLEVIDFGREIVLVPVPNDPMENARGMLNLRRSLQNIMDESRREQSEREKNFSMIPKKSRARH